MGRTHDVTISGFDLDRLEAELEDQARLLGMSGERECDLRGKLERERVLADRLADALLDTMSAWILSPDAEKAAKALAQWKEARHA